MSLQLFQRKVFVAFVISDALEWVYVRYSIWRACFLVWCWNMNRIFHSYVTHRLEILVKEGFCIWECRVVSNLSLVWYLSARLARWLANKVRDGELNCRKKKETHGQKDTNLVRLRGWEQGIACVVSMSVQSIRTEYRVHDCPAITFKIA